MKDKILIIGNQGAGKTRLAIELAEKLGYAVVDDVKNIEKVKKMATPNTIYVSNGITDHEALWHSFDMFDFTIIKLIIL